MINDHRRNLGHLAKTDTLLIFLICLWPSQTIGDVYDFQISLCGKVWEGQETVKSPIFCDFPDIWKLGFSFQLTVTLVSVNDICFSVLVNNRAQGKAVRTMVTVTLLFAFCWLPYHIVFMYLDMSLAELSSSLTSFTLFVQWLMFANSACNPFVYAALNDNYKRVFAAMVFRRPSRVPRNMLIRVQTAPRGVWRRNVVFHLPQNNWRVNSSVYTETKFEQHRSVIYYKNEVENNCNLKSYWYFDHIQKLTVR